MNKYKIEIKQNCYCDRANQWHNEYHFYTENGIYLGGLLFPCNGQYLFDDKILTIIAKAISIRWGLTQAKAK